MATASRRGSRRGTTTEESTTPTRRGSTDAPRGRARRGSAAPDDTPEWPAKSDDDEAPAPRGRARRGSARTSESSEGASAPKRARGRSGWDNVEEQQKVTKTTSSDYVPKETIWKPDEEVTLVKFVEDAPFVSYAQHWINSKPKGRAGWECIAPLPYDETPEDIAKYGEVGDCPLCETLDESPRMQVMFNVIIFNEEKEDWEYRVLRAGVTLTDQLKSLNDGRHGPLSSHYWEMSATGTKGSYSPNCLVVKDRDLPEDWDLEPLTDAQMETLLAGAFDESVISFPTSKQLEDLLDDMLG